jgi:16S rRNA processing protein RimM
LKGEVRIEQILEDDSVFEPGQRVMLSAASGADHEMEIEFFRRQHGRCVVKFRGLDAISEVEQYVGSELKVPAAALPVVPEGWFYTFQLRGCRVFTPDGECIGTVTGVLDSGGTQILSVDHENEETLVPFAQSFIRKIDLEQRRIEVDLPDGLRDLNKGKAHKKQRRK